MVRCKKIIAIAILGILVFSLPSCKVQQHRYVSLYLDNSMPIEDTPEASETLFVLHDVDSFQLIDSTTTKVYSKSKDGLQPEILSSDTGTLDITNFENRAVDSIYIAEARQLMQQKNDSIGLLKKRISNLENQETPATDTVYITKEVIKTVLADNYENYNDKDTSATLVVQSDSIKFLQNQIIALQNQKTPAPDTVYITKEVIKMVSSDNSENYNEIDTSAPPIAQSDSIKLLLNQIIALQKQKTIAPDTVYITKEGLKTVPADSSENTNDKETSARLVAQSDSIKLLKNQIVGLQNQKTTAPDTVYIKKEVIKTVPADNNKAVSNIDTITIVAYYEMGSIAPAGGDSILHELKRLISTKNVLKISISGYTDISGNRNINKAITSKRIVYFVERLTPVFPVENIYSQNFGDAFASDSILANERKLVFSVILRK